MKGELLNRVIVWKRPDGGFSITYLLRDAKLVVVQFPDSLTLGGEVAQKGRVLVITKEWFERGFSKTLRDRCVVEEEPDDNLLSREIGRIKSNEVLKDWIPVITPNVELPSGGKRQWRLNGDKLVHDPTIETPVESSARKKAKLVQELRQSGLSEDSIRMITREPSI